MDLVAKVLERDVRASARLLRWIDDGLPEARRILKQLYRHTGRATIIGITGNPGAGKSTLTDQLIGRFRGRGKTVAVAAIDPSSPFTGGPSWAIGSGCRSTPWTTGSSSGPSPPGGIWAG